MLALCCIEIDSLAKKVTKLHENALCYRGTMERAKQVTTTYEKLMESHQGKLLVVLECVCTCNHHLHIHVYTPSTCIHTLYMHTHPLHAYTPSTCVHTLYMCTPSTCAHTLYMRTHLHAYTPSTCVHTLCMCTHPLHAYTPSTCVHTLYMCTHPLAILFMPATITICSVRG